MFFQWNQRTGARTDGSEAERQGNALLEMASLSPESFQGAEVARLFELAERPANKEIELQAAALLSQLYPARAPRDPAFARRAHRILLADLRDDSNSLKHREVSWLAIAHLRDANLEHVPWESVDEVVSAVECFYGMDHHGMTAHDAQRRVRDLLKSACSLFIRQDRWESAFRLMTRVHISDELIDAELFRLRNILNLYEQRRARRFRRAMTWTLVTLWAYLIAVAPLLFITLESAARAAAKMPEVTWIKSFYWSMITATTVGYGDLYPITAAGMILAVGNAVMGVVTIGVISGLILNSLTARRIG